MPAVSQSLGRAAWSLAAMAHSTPAAAMARASTSSTTGRTAARSIRVAIRRWIPHLRRRRPRAARCAARTCAPAATRCRWTAPFSALIPRPALRLPDNPLAGTPTPTRAALSRMACAIRSASLSVPARTKSGSAMWAGTMGGDQPDSQPERRRRRELRLAVLRRSRSPSWLRRREP